MSDTKKTIAKLTSQEMSGGVSALADRPNEAAQYGQGGLSAAQLKAWFDKLVKLVAQKINTVIDSYNGVESTKYIDTGIINGSVTLSLFELLAELTSGGFAGRIMAYSNLSELQDADVEDLKSVQTIICSMAASISSLSSAITSAVSTHNTANDTHIDIRNLISSLETSLTTTLGTIQSNVSALTSRMSNAEIEIDVLQADSVAQASRISTNESEITAIKGEIGNGEISAIGADIKAAILSMNEDIDALQVGAVPRINRGIIEFGNPAQTPSAELIAALTAKIQEVCGRAPNNTDKLTVEDTEGTGEGSYWTYNYWTGYNELTDGWYWDSYSLTAAVNDIPAYIKNINSLEWGSADENGLFHIEITPATHNQGTNATIMVDLFSIIDGNYTRLNTFTPKLDGTVDIYTDTVFAGFVVIRAAGSYFVSDWTIEMSQVRGLTAALAEKQPIKKVIFSNSTAGTVSGALSEVLTSGKRYYISWTGTQESKLSGVWHATSIQIEANEIYLNFSATMATTNGSTIVGAKLTQNVAAKTFTISQFETVFTVANNALTAEQLTTGEIATINEIYYLD